MWVQALEDLAKNTEDPKTSSAPGPPKGFDPNAVAHVERELVQVKSYFEGQIRTLGQNVDATMAQLREKHLSPRGVTPMGRGYYPDRAEPAQRGPFGGYFPNRHGCLRQRGATRSCIHNGTGLMVYIMRRRDTMDCQTIGYQPTMACHRGETKTRMPTSGIVGN